MGIKLVALDLDDTLLDHSSIISKRAKQTIRRAIEQKVHVTVATGRMYKSAQPYAAELELDIPIITYNGGLIKAIISGEIIYHQPIEQQLAHRAAALCMKHGVYIQTYIEDTLYVAELNEPATFYSKLAGVAVVPIGKELCAISGKPTKMLAIADAKIIQEMKGMFEKQFAGQLYTCSSRPTFLEITHPLVNKGQALSILAAKLGILRENIMAVGDSGNDIDMLRYAGLGVAMGNASQSIKDIADYVTCANDEDGVAEAIEKFVLI